MVFSCCLIWSNTVLNSGEESLLHLLYKELLWALLIFPPGILKYVPETLVFCFLSSTEGVRLTLFFARWCYVVLVIIFFLRLCTSLGVCFLFAWFPLLRWLLILSPDCCTLPGYLSPLFSTVGSTALVGRLTFPFQPLCFPAKCMLELPWPGLRSVFVSKDCPWEFFLPCCI